MRQNLIIYANDRVSLYGKNVSLYDKKVSLYGDRLILC
jgi:hypothetical protein